MIEALEKGQAIDLSGLPPSPGQGEEHWLWWRLSVHLLECTLYVPPRLDANNES